MFVTKVHMEVVGFLFVAGVVIWVIVSILSGSDSSPSRQRTSYSTAQTNKDKRTAQTNEDKRTASGIRPVRVPESGELTTYLAHVADSTSILALSLRAYSDWFRQNDVPYLASSDSRVHIPPQLFYFVESDTGVDGRKWSFSAFPIPSTLALADQARRFGHLASRRESPRVFLLVFEDRGSPDGRRLGFLVVHRSGKHTLRFRDIIEQNGVAQLGTTYSAPEDIYTTPLNVARTFWKGAGVNQGTLAQTGEASTHGESDQREQRNDRNTQPLRITVNVETSDSTARSASSVERALAASRDAWNAPGQPVTVRGRTISSGMVYVGETLRANGLHGGSPALINPTLPVATGTDKAGANFGYWPSYAQIPPESRGAFLDWLASGRRDTSYDIGYVFIFFYGLERRILVDARHDEQARTEVPDLLDELEALNERFGPVSHSFRGYCSGLIAYAREAFGHQPSVSGPAYPSADGAYRMSSAEKTALGRILADERAIPADWALAWVRSDPEARLRTPGTRCVEEFDTLFLRRYEDRFGEGLIVDVEETRRRITYRPASAGIRETFSQRIEGVADVDRVLIPPDLVAFSHDIEADLDDYSRWIGRRDDRSSPAALGLLPPELIAERCGDEARTLIDDIHAWLGDEDRVVISTDRILSRWPSKNDDYLTKTEAESLSGFLAGFELGIEPDVRYSRNPSKRDHVTLFRLPGPDREPSGVFESARLLLHLAAAVAGADEEVTSDEEKHLERHLERALDLTPAEQSRLRAYMARLLMHPPTLRGVRRRAKDMDETVRKRLGKFLLTVAGADGHLDANEITVLEKIYDMLGLNEDRVHQDLHDLSARDPGRIDRGPVTVIRADETQTYRIPDEHDAADAGEPSAHETDGLDLDLDRVAAVQNETKDVADVLSKVFEEEEEVSPQFDVEGLTDHHHAFLAELSAKMQWPRAEYEDLAESHGLIPGFATEQINASAFEVADEPLLEGDDPIELNPYALNALQS